MLTHNDDLQVIHIHSPEIGKIISILWGGPTLDEYLHKLCERELVANTDQLGQEIIIAIMHIHDMNHHDMHYPDVNGDPWKGFRE